MKKLSHVLMAVCGLIVLESGVSSAATIPFDPGNGTIEVSFSGITGAQTVTLTVGQQVTYSCNATTGGSTGPITSNRTVCQGGTTQRFASIENPGLGDGAHLITLATSNVANSILPGLAPASTTVTAADPAVHIVVPLAFTSPGGVVASFPLIGPSGTAFIVTVVDPSISASFSYFLTFDDSMTADFGANTVDTPLPAALPLFAAAVGGIGATARRSRKNRVRQE